MKELKTFLQEDGSYRYSIFAPDVVVEREDRPHYEKDRFLSMEMNLKNGDVLFDVGSELGWQSAIYAKFVGPENMCLFEHVGELWPTIHHIWAMNGYAAPKLAFWGFVSNRDTGVEYVMNAMPRPASWPELQSFESWSKIHANTDGQETTIDHIVERSSVVPNAITIDVEGAEFRVLEGASATLHKYRPLVWVSIHPELRLKSFNTTKQAVRELMKQNGYERQYLGVDHEEHDFYHPIERADDVMLVSSPWKTHATRHESFEEKIPGWTDCMGMPYASAWGAS